jgi:hypothetical protein
MQIFTNDDITIEKYADSINERYMRKSLRDDNFDFETSGEKIKQINEINKYEFTTDIKSMKTFISDCLHEIAVLHPYLVQKYCPDDKYNDNLGFPENPALAGIYAGLKIKEELIQDRICNEWRRFIQNFFKLMSQIKDDVRTVENFKESTALCLDISRNDEWNDIPLYTRVYLADKFFHCDIKWNELTAEPDLSIKNISKNIIAIEKKYDDHENTLQPLNPDIKDLKNIYKDCIVSIEDETSMESLDNVCLTSFLNMVKTETVIKKCGNCGKYFIPLLRSDTIYCDRQAPQDNVKTCQEYGSYKAWSDNLKNDEVAGKHRNTYMKLQLLVKRNPDMTSHKNKFEEYKRLSKQWKLDVKNGVKSKEDYLKWINSY